jgi:hypothetical protein
LKTRMRDMQMTSSYKPSAPTTGLPAWQREPQKPVGANKWSINSDPSMTVPSPTSPSLASSGSAPVAPGASQTLMSTGGTTPVSASPVRSSSPAPPPAVTTAPVAGVASAPAAAAPTKNPGERPLSFQSMCFLFVSLGADFLRSRDGHGCAW